MKGDDKKLCEGATLAKSIWTSW